MNNTAVTWTYEDVKKDVMIIARKFWLRFGGDLQEIISEANEHFVDAYYKWNKEKAGFRHWINWYVYHNLLRTRQKVWKRASLVGEQVNVDVDLTGTEDKQFNINLFTEDLSEDASLVVKVIMETDLHYKPSLMKFLKGLGWSVARILESFGEITNLLCGD